MSLKLITKKKKIHQILNAYKSKLQKYKLYEKLITYLLFFSVHYTETQTDSWTLSGFVCLANSLSSEIKSKAI